jgi:hypothetical protein
VVSIPFHLPQLLFLLFHIFIVISRRPTPDVRDGAALERTDNRTLTGVLVELNRRVVEPSTPISPSSTTSSSPSELG